MKIGFGLEKNIKHSWNFFFGKKKSAKPVRRAVAAHKRPPLSAVASKEDFEFLFEDWAVSTNPIDLPSKEAGTKMVGYVRWIPEHSDILIARVIDACPHIKFVDVNIFKGQQHPEIRRALTQAAERDPIRFRRLALASLLALRTKGIDAIVLTLDWTAPLREIVFACRSIGIRTILIPHESVFSTTDTFYYQKRRRTNAPLTDHVLCWGEMQAGIFEERGYPRSRIVKVGSPKLDFDFKYRPALTRQQFEQLFGIAENAKIVLFTMQPMDNYNDKKYARQRQASAISDVLQYCHDRGHHLFLRTPPSREQILPEHLQLRLNASPNVSIDVAGEYVLTPEETLCQADLVVSVNSTMLFEARLMSKPSIAMKYIDLPTIWENTDILIATSGLQFSLHADEALRSNDHRMSERTLEWAASNFSNEKFGIDGEALSRIQQNLDSILQAPHNQLQLTTANAEPKIGNELFRPSAVVVAKDLIDEYGAERMKSYLGVERVFAASSVFNAASGDLFVRSPSIDDPKFESTRIGLGRPVYILSDEQLNELASVAAVEPQKSKSLLQDAPDISRAES
ncbi:hypothetical protein [Rhizobium herbae]|uniref:Uncharacterized protein n=1 Tax=Rhizobium herbae TaxID=508661 RepID=A0ABS4ETJ1_9HYPH|nr:hypothetical protein [Rhizobium herbae]MBP1861111.1 hypothetical protein [Rhizobium herbae]